jgi:hypothetical protein
MNYDYCVCVDAGQFDIVLDRFSSELCATRFAGGVEPYCDYSIQIKPATEIRELIVGYQDDRVFTSACIEQGTEQKSIIRE